MADEQNQSTPPPNANVIYAWGWRSFVEGHSLASNPYPSRGMEWHREQWRAGYLAARETKQTSEPQGPRSMIGEERSGIDKDPRPLGAIKERGV